MAKELTLEQAEKQFEEAKATAKESWEAVLAYRKEHKLRPGYKPEKDAVGKGYKAVLSAHKEAKTTREEAEAAYKALKPKTRAGRGSTIYEYPDGMSSEEKKKFRTAARAAAKKAAKEAAKGADGDAPKATKKKATKAEPEAEAEVEAPAKKTAKKAVKKKAKPSVEEDED